MAFFLLGATDCGIDKKAGGKSAIQQVANRLIELGDAVAG
jgi:hypothetical protein